MTARRTIGKWLNEQPNGDIDRQALSELCAEYDSLLLELKEARYNIEDWGGYASGYFQLKYDLAGDLARIDKALASAPAESEPTPSIQAHTDAALEYAAQQCIDVGKDGAGAAGEVWAERCANRLRRLRGTNPLAEAQAKIAQLRVELDSKDVECLTARERELILGMIEVQRDHASRCDNIQNRVMADKQKGYDLERVALLEKVLSLGLENGNAEIDSLRAALEESVKLQSHYAELLNMHDGGQRLVFTDAEAWLERIRRTRA